MVGPQCCSEGLGQQKLQSSPTFWCLREGVRFAGPSAERDWRGLGPWYRQAWDKQDRSRTTLRSCHKGSQVHTACHSQGHLEKASAWLEGPQFRTNSAGKTVQGMKNPSHRKVCSAMPPKPTYLSSLESGSARGGLPPAVGVGDVRDWLQHSPACFLWLPTPRMALSGPPTP